MVASFGCFHNHVVNINLQVLAYIMGEHNVHESLVGGTNILEAEGYDIVVVVIMIQHKQCLGRA